MVGAGLRLARLVVTHLAVCYELYVGLVIFAIIYGLDWFATVPPSMAITADTFGRQNVGKVYGWIFMSHQIGAAIMASAAGAVRDYLGEYNVAFMAGGFIAMIAAGLALQIKSKPSVAAPATGGRAAGTSLADKSRKSDLTLAIADGRCHCFRISIPDLVRFGEI